MTLNIKRNTLKALAAATIIFGIFCELANTQLANTAVAITGIILVSVGLLCVFLWIVDYLHELDERTKQPRE